MDLNTEKQIVDAARSDPEKFAGIYEAYADDIYRYSYSLVSDKDQAEEITQECFTRALEKLDSFEWQGISIKAWLIAISRNIAYSRFAKKTELPAGDFTEESPEFSHPAKEVDVKMAKDVNEALAKLPSITREIIVLKIWEEYKFVEIAAMVDKSESAVKMQFYRGMEKLQEMLKKNGYDEYYVVYPLLFNGVSKVAALPEFHLPTNMSAPGFLDKFKHAETMKNSSNLTRGSQLSASKIAGYGAIVTLAAGILGLASFVAFDYLQNDEEPDENRVQTEQTEDEEEPEDSAERENTEDNVEETGGTSDTGEEAPTQPETAPGVPGGEQTFNHTYRTEAIEYQPDPTNYFGFQRCDYQLSQCYVYAISKDLAPGVVIGEEYIISFNTYSDAEGGAAAGTSYYVVEAPVEVAPAI